MISTINCDPAIGVFEKTARCPRCGQWHLRPGYCQALDPTSYWHVSPLGQKWKAAHPDLSTPVDKRVDIALVVDTRSVDKSAPVDKSVDKPASVDTASVDKSTNVDTSVDTSAAPVDRLSYQREWVRRKRAAEPSE